MNDPVKTKVATVALSGVVLGVCWIYSDQLLDIALIPRFLFIALSSLMLLLGATVAYTRGNKAKIGGLTLVDLTLLLWMGAAFLSGINSDIWGEYLFSVGRITVYVGLFFAIKFIIRQFDLDKQLFLQLLILSTIGLCLIGAYQLVTDTDGFELRQMMAVKSLFANKNLFAEYLALTVPFLLLASLNLNLFWKVLTLLALGLSLVFVALIMGRGAWVSVGIGVTIFTVFQFRGENLHNLLVKKQLVILFISVLALFGLIIGFDHFVHGGLIDRFASIFQTSEGTAGFRLSIWQRSLQLISGSPWFGIGAGDWKVEFQQFGMNLSDHKFTVEPLNDYVAMACEIGLPGLIAYLFTLGLAIFSAAKMFLKQNDQFALPVAVVLVSFSVISFFNFPLHRIEHVTLMVFCLAYADKDSNSFTSYHLRMALTAVMACALVFCVHVGRVRYEGESETKKALLQRSKQNWNGVIPHIDNVDHEYYPLEPSATPVVWYRGLAYFQLGNTEKALKDFISAYNCNPYHAHVLNNLATCYALMGKFDQAIELYSTAIRLYPEFLDPHTNLVELYLHVNLPEEAIRIIDGSTRQVRKKFKKKKRMILKNLDPKKGSN
ncbi:MAG: hypothetical protein RL266_1483 [Bacteroidota bacterium]|jgi:O-antigen ligase